MHQSIYEVHRLHFAPEVKALYSFYIHIQQTYFIINLIISNIIIIVFIIIIIVNILIAITISIVVNYFIYSKGTIND